MDQEDQEGLAQQGLAQQGLAQKGVAQKGSAQRNVAAGIVLHRPEPLLLEALCGGLASDAVPVIIFANGPIGPAEEVLSRHRPFMRIDSPRNVGLAEGLNRIVAAASEAGCVDLILFDQDSAPPKGLVAALLELRQAMPDRGRVAAIGPALTPPPGEGFRPLRYARIGPDNHGLVPVMFTPTSGALMSIASLDAIGPFRADFFIDGIDVEWGLRARAMGYSSHYAPGVPMPHRWGTAAATNEPQILRLSPLRLYYYLRNAVATLRLPHAPRRWRLSTTARLVAQCLHLARRGDGRWTLAQRAIRDGWHGRLGPAPADLEGQGK